MRGNQELSASDKEYASEQAQLAFARLPEEAVRTLATWWSEWYGIVGHRRLGRLLLSRRGSGLNKGRSRGTSDSRKIRLHADRSGRVIDEGLKYVLAEAPLDTSAFFDLKEIAGEIQIVLNSAHPAYKRLEAFVNSGEGTSSSTSDSVCVLLLQAWADLERRQPHGARAYQTQQMREDWGRSLRQVLSAGGQGE